MKEAEMSQAALERVQEVEEELSHVSHWLHWMSSVFCVYTRRADQAFRYFAAKIHEWSIV